MPEKSEMDGNYRKFETDFHSLEKLYRELMRVLISNYREGNISPITLRALGSPLLINMIPSVVDKKFRTRVSERLEKLYEEQVEEMVEKAIKKSRRSYRRFRDQFGYRTV